MLVVFLVTFLIIANPLTSLLVFFCVAFTVVSITSSCVVIIRRRFIKRFSNSDRFCTTLVILAVLHDVYYHQNFSLTKLYYDYIIPLGECCRSNVLLGVDY